MFIIVLLLIFCFIFCDEVNWEMYQLSDEKLVCNDGSPYKFFIRKSTTSSNKFNLYLMGGWWCYDKISCDSRDEDLKSSKNLNTSYVQNVNEGIFDERETYNPSFYDFNQIYLYYCSSDAWSGESNENVLGYHFLGKKIVEGVIDYLSSEGMMKDENLEVILTGSSAGGVGVMVNSDYVEGILSSKFTKFEFSSIVDSGLLWIYNPLDVTTMSVMKQMVLGIDLWKASVNENCVNSVGVGEDWKCFFMEYNLQPVETTLFIFDDRFDLWQIEWNLGIYSNPHTKLDLRNNITQITFAEKFGQYTLDTVTEYFSSSSRNPKNGVFLSSCFNHCACGGSDFNNFAIKKDGVVTTLQQDITNWYDQTGSYVLISECNEFDCSIGCPPLPS